MTTRIAIGTLLTSLVLVACGGAGDKAGGSSSGAPVAVTLATSTQPPAQVLLWIADVARATGGRLRIAPSDRYRTGDEHAEQHLLADLEHGQAQLGWVGVRALDRVGVKSFQPLVAPFLIDSYPMLGRVFASGLVDEMVADAKVPGAVVIGVLPGPFRRFLGTSRPLLAPADFDGAVIGVQDSALSERTLELLGATPLARAAESRLDGIDGYEQQLSSIVGNRYDAQPIKVTGNVELWARPVALLASRAWFDKLSDAQRTALRSAVKAVAGSALEATQREDADATAALCQSAATVVSSAPEQLAALRAAVEPIYRDLAADPSTASSFAAISKLEGSDPPADIPACSTVTAASPKPATPAAADTSELDGEYAATIRENDLADADRLPEQYGETRLVIDRGQFRLSHDSDAANWTADGSAAIDGTALTLGVGHVEDVGPHGVPDGIPLDGGDTLTFAWKRADDGSLQLAADAGLPALVAKPLRRTGRAPGQRPDQDPKLLEGTWTTDATAADVIAHHEDQNGIHNNTGPLRLVIDGDRFAWTQQTPDGGTSGEGTFVTAGDTVEFDHTDVSGGDSPIPMWLRWSVRHGQLTFSEAPGFSPEAWTYHPWRRAK